MTVPGQQTPGFTGSRTDVCIYRGQIYHQDDTWQDGCTYTCQCTDASQGKYSCTDRCPTYPRLPPSCVLVEDPTEACCKKPVCNPIPTIPNNPNLSTLTPPVPTHDMCEYHGHMYRQSQQWYDGCSKVCRCENATLNVYRCEDRCPVYSQIPAGCSLVPDPSNPTCCKIPDCPVPSGVSPSAGYVPNPLSPTAGSVTGIGRVPTPGNTPSQVPGQPLVPTPPSTGCFYNNKVYQQGDRWTVGCEQSCVCSNGTTGQYTCTQL